MTRRNKPATKIDGERLAQDVLKYPEDCLRERAQRFGVSKTGIEMALKRPGLSRKKTLTHPRADEQARGLLRELTVTVPEEPAENREEDEARREAATEAIKAIEDASHTLGADNADMADLYTRAAVRMMANYQRRLGHDESQAVEGQYLRASDQAEITLRLAGLKAEREALYRLARNGRISDEMLRRLVHQVDLVEARYLH